VKPSKTGRFAGILFIIAIAEAGCRATPTGLAIAAARDGVRLADVTNAGKELVGRPVTHADERFGKRTASCHDALSGDDLVFYPILSLPAMDHFRVVRVTPSGEILAVGGWLRNADGVEDLFKLLVTRRRVVGRSFDDAVKRARLKKPILILSEGDGKALRYVFDVTNVSHVLPRVLQLTVDENGKCIRADYFGALSRWVAPSDDGSPERRESGEHVPS
jgi:hypothetical protein